MKSLLVLYPIYPYAHYLIGQEEPDEIKKKFARIYQGLIRRRYPGFQIIWMMFSREDSPGRPDTTLLWEGIKMGKKDIVAACGVSFDKHCGMKIYPNPETILGACPRPIEKLVVGGFHFWDCVADVARYAHGQGIDVLVDDDLTEFFFWKIRQNGVLCARNIPGALEQSLAKERKRIAKSAPGYLEEVRQARKDKPWLVRI